MFVKITGDPFEVDSLIKESLLNEWKKVDLKRRAAAIELLSDRIKEQYNCLEPGVRRGWLPAVNGQGPVSPIVPALSVYRPYFEPL